MVESAMTRLEKAGSTAVAVGAILALCGYFHPIVGAAGIATNDSVDTKLSVAVGDLKDIILADKKDNVEFWINYLNFKANRGEANDFDMTLLDEKYRQREELLKK